MSSRTLNRVTLIGNVGSDPTLKYLQNGTPLALFRMATNRTYTPSTTEESIEDTEWHQVVIFGKLAEIAEKIVKRSAKVYVEGRLKTTEFQGDDGRPVQKTEIVANELILLDKRGGSNSNGGGGEGIERDIEIPRDESIPRDEEKANKEDDDYIPEYSSSF